jgi:hypothetical protein
MPGSVLTPKQKALWHDEEGSKAILDAQVLPQTVETEHRGDGAVPVL